jgi:sec-independent protein translocase protein TatA
MGELTLPGMLVILVIVLILFGPRKLPELGSSFGKAIRGFKEGIRGDYDKVAAVPEPEKEAAQTTLNSGSTPNPPQAQ